MARAPGFAQRAAEEACRLSLSERGGAGVAAAGRRDSGLHARTHARTYARSSSRGRCAGGLAAIAATVTLPACSTRREGTVVCSKQMEGRAGVRLDAAQHAPIFYRLGSRKAAHRSIFASLATVARHHSRGGGNVERFDAALWWDVQGCARMKSLVVVLDSGTLRLSCQEDVFIAFT